MSAVYLADGTSATVLLSRVMCRDEGRELHDLLRKNHDLLPGEQIDPEAPRRWLLIKHEMPVADPATGSASRWSIDLFFVDQYGIPTLVECKRNDDTRARREVVAQMLEYAANGHHYWTKSEMRSFAEASAGGAEQLRDKLRVLLGDSDPDVEAFFTTVEQNLRESKMRLVFFLEKSSNELRSMVDFLNKQLKDTEVFLVEARLYQQGNNRIVVPWLFGYTEEARVAKRDSRAEVMRAAGDKGKEAFWKAVDAANFPESTLNAMHTLVDNFTSGPLSRYGEPSYGANCIFVIRSLVASRGFFALNRNGALEMYFGYWHEADYSDIGERQASFRSAFTDLVERVFKVRFDEKQRKAFPKIPVDTWVPQAAEFVDGLQRLVEKHSAVDVSAARLK